MAIIDAVRVGGTEYEGWQASAAPSFEVPPVEVSADLLDSSNPLGTLNRFFVNRELAQRFPGVRGEAQKVICEDVAKWFADNYPSLEGSTDDYVAASNPQHSMLGRLLDFLKSTHHSEISGPELLATEDFLQATYGLNKNKQNGRDLSQGIDAHAFIVPVRLSTDHPEYSKEIRPLVPIFHYVPDDLVPHFLRDMPPFVADRYENGGLLVVAPVTEDMRRDLSSVSVKDFRDAARKRVNDGIELAESMGAREFGLGATFPGLMSLGEASVSEDTTTGHGGTTALMVMTIDKLRNEVLGRRKKIRIGVLGLGQIGLPTAQVIAEFFPESPINVFDKNSSRMKVLAEGGRKYAPTESVEDLIRNSDIILSSATSTFNFVDKSDPNFIDVSSLEGKIFIDDSEPHSIRPEQVVALGGIALDVIGRDYSGKVLRRRSDFGYGGTLVDRRRDAFGCELEVGVLSYLRRQLIAEGLNDREVRAKVGIFALRRQVTAEDTIRWVNLFKSYGIAPAPFQAFGKAYETVKRTAIQRLYQSIGRVITGRRSPKNMLTLAV